MISWNSVQVKLGDLRPWGRNPKSISKDHAERLLASWKEIGQFQTIAIGPDNDVYDGHQRLSVLMAAYGADYQVDARQSSKPLTEKQREKLVIEAHAGTNGQFDWDQLSGWDAQELKEWGMGEDLLKDWKRDVKALDFMLKAEEEPDDEDDEEPVREIVYRTPDAIFASDNDYGIPLLDINMQAKFLEAPFCAWGAGMRKTKMTGTYHFYVEDYRFGQIWKTPEDIVNSSCHCAVEPNFSIYGDMPRAVALYQMYRKRWVARYLQSFGIGIFVDLNIAERYQDLRLLGVPRGWKAYCTRAYGDRLDGAEREYLAAIEHAGVDTILFVCYGGGHGAEEMSKKNGWIWYQDQQTKDAKHG